METVTEVERDTKKRRQAAAMPVPPAPNANGVTPIRRPATDNRLVKASFNLPADELDALRELADRRKTSATQVVRQALATESYLQRIVDDGGTIMAKVGRRARELIFSQMQVR
jgi:hypothetical protein